MTFQIRNFTPEDFLIVKDWANNQHWNEGFFDHLAFRQIDKDGFWMGVLDGQPIASCSALQYDQNFAFVGLYIAKPQYRGKGYGLQVWKKALSRITAKNIALQGVKQQEQNYVKSGFKTYHDTVRYMVNGTNKQHYSPNLVECKDVDFEKLSAYDRQNFPAERKSFLKKWITLPESNGKAFVKDGKIEGYGVLRRSQQGFRLGPLFADSYEVACQILMSLRGSVSDDKNISIDIPDVNKSALNLAEKFNMKPSFTCARMYTNQIPDLHFDKSVYGITSLQFG